MYDRPSAQALVEAARQHLENHVVAAVKSDPKLYFETLVAINVLRVVERELALAPDHLAAEWASLKAITGEESAALSPDPNALYGHNQALAAAIRAGEYDDATRSAALLDHLLAVTRLQLEVGNPRFLAALDAEDGASGTF
jgi:hypothetical protein